MAAAQPSGPASLEGQHLLIIDDDGEIRRMIALVLKSAGVVVSEAGSAAEAQRKIAEREFAVLLLDWNLVDMPAAEFLDRAELQRPGTSRRCIVITGDLIRRGDLHDAERRGLPLVRKPFRPGELLDAVRRALAA